WSDRFALSEGYQPMMRKAISNAMKKYGITPEDVTKLVYSGPDARAHGSIAGALKFDAKTQVQYSLFNEMGNTGTAFPLMLLVAALEQAKAGDTLLVAGYGDGVDVILLKVTDAIEKARDRHGVLGYLQSKKMLPSHLKFLRLRHLFHVEPQRFTPIVPSLAQGWRERDSMFKLHASKCNQCGWVDFPIRRVCPNCLAKDDYAQVKLVGQKVTVYSFSADTVAILPEVTDPPLGRAMIDFEGGVRMELEMTDYGDIQEMKVGQLMEMTFFAEPALIVSAAIISAEVPALKEAVTSAVIALPLKSRAEATTAANCFSAKGELVVARYKPSTVSRSMPAVQSRTASTAIVNASSSAPATERSPAPPVPISLPISSRASL
ncbi:3-oxoacyl-[acyl-carrier-protein] synthase III C-terminal domain-containing protein, partial [Chloroflexota bacterium]